MTDNLDTDTRLAELEETVAALTKKTSNLESWAGKADRQMLSLRDGVINLAEAVDILNGRGAR